MIESNLFKDEEVYVTLHEANKALTSRAFTLWIMIHNLSIKSSDLISGRKHISKILGWSKSTTDRYLRELVLKGFVKHSPPSALWKCSEFSLIKVCKLDAKSRFVKLII